MSDEDGIITMLVGLVTISLLVVIAWLSDAFAKRNPATTQRMKEWLSVVMVVVLLLGIGIGATYLVGWVVLSLLDGLGVISYGS